ncbi:unnamed protein product, partial [marine sediment metagenome]
VVSLGEEFFFRGFIQRNLERKIGHHRGILFTAFIFTIFHAWILIFLPLEISLPFILVVLFLGLLFGIVYSETGNIFSTWIGHGLLVSLTGLTVGIF